MLKGKELLSRSRSSRSEASFWWLGQQSFILKLAGSTILLDPFLMPHEKRRVPPLFDAQECAGIVDLVCCTHDHGDHLDPTAISGLAEHTVAKFVVPRAHHRFYHGHRA